MYLYFSVADNGLFKIGRSENPVARSANIKSQSPCEVSTFLWIHHDDERTLEDDFHQALAGKRVRGEWFALDYHDWRWILDTLQDDLDAQLTPNTQAYLRSTLKEMRDWGFFDLGRFQQSYATTRAATMRLSVMEETRMRIPEHVKA